MADANKPILKFPAPRRKKRGVRRFLMFSTLTRMIFLANLFGLIILITGALAINQFSRGLVDAKIDAMQSQTRLISSILGEQATGKGVSADLDEELAKRILSRIDVPDKSRLRLYDRNSRLIADSELLDDSIVVDTLDPIVPQAKKVTPKEKWWVKLQKWMDRKITDWRVFRQYRERKQRHLERDIKAALKGQTIATEQYEDRDLLVAVVMPVKRVADIQGALVFETHDVDSILASQRRGLTPIILVAILTSILSSLALTLFIALPIRHLARAAEQVVRSSDKRDSIPDLSSRKDEIGDLSVVMRRMTRGLYDRIDDIAKFAADVAHEIKNPLTSLRSASESLRRVKTDEKRGKLIDIIEQDVARMDRLITDISKASRMDAALAKEKAHPLDLGLFLNNMADFYNQTNEKGAVPVIVTTQKPDEPIIVRALEESLGQVLRNLIDNALTFSPKDKTANVRLAYEIGQNDLAHMAIVTVDDDGPGIPDENMKTIFDRFYTERPKGASFGNHSGLGLAICRQIMDAHHGSIYAENRTGKDGRIKGARFVVVIPMHFSSKDTRKETSKNKTDKKSGQNNPAEDKAA